MLNLVQFFIFFGRLAFNFLNMGLTLGFIFLAIIALRPVTNPILRPRHRVWLWGAGWLCGFHVYIYRAFVRLSLLPVSFRSFILPRMEGGVIRAEGVLEITPAYLPSAYKGPGEYTIILPGGSEVPISLNDAIMAVVGMVWLASFAATIFLDTRKIKGLKKLAEQGELATLEQLTAWGMDDPRIKIEVRLCENLPTSFVFVRSGVWFRRDGEYVICLQKELSPRRMDLVLRHELAHIQMRHLNIKSFVTVGLFFAWWNPVMWLAHRLTCRDIEMACDEAVLAALEPTQRRDYARTLTELAAGKPMWGGLTSFGECDASLRIKNVVAWKPEGEGRASFSLVALALLLLFFYGGDWSTPTDSYESEIPTPPWSEYVVSDKMLEDIAQANNNTGIVFTEIWNRIENQVVMLGEDGQWYFVNFRWTGRRWYPMNVIPMRVPPFLDEYTQVK